MTVEPEPRCRDAREWLSAHRDGEAFDDPAARAHVAACAACGAWSADADRITQRARVHRAGASPDVVSAALAAGRGQDTSVRRRRDAVVGRSLLAVSGSAALVIAGVGLVAGPYVDVAGAHLGGELHAFEAALGIAFLLAARCPERYARALLPLTATVAALSAATSTLAASSGRVDVLAEASHLPPLVALVGLVLLAPVPGRVMTAPLR